MRRVALALLVAGLAAALAPPAGAASQTVRVPWMLIGTGPGARSLIVRYEHGGCEAPVHATVAGTPTAIRVRLSRVEPLGGPPRPICAQVIQILTMKVHLRHPVGGRRIRGGTPGAALPVPSGARTVPRVLGLAPPDARSALAANGLGSAASTRKRDVRLPQVVAQSPRAGAKTTGGMVRLVVSGR